MEKLDLDEVYDLLKEIEEEEIIECYNLITSFGNKYKSKWYILT